MRPTAATPPRRAIFTAAGSPACGLAGWPKLRRTWRRPRGATIALRRCLQASASRPEAIRSRQMDAVGSPVIVTIGAIHGGVRYNIIPDRVEMMGTIRYLNPDTREGIYTRVRRTVEDIAHGAGATAEVTIEHNAIPVVNPPAITDRTLAVLQRTLGEANVRAEPPGMVAEEFA